MKKCETCNYYIAHYVLDKRRGLELLKSSGHCTGHKTKYTNYKLTENCEDYKKGVNDFERVKTLSLFTTLLRVEKVFAKFQKELKELSKKIKTEH